MIEKKKAIIIFQKNNKVEMENIHLLSIKRANLFLRRDICTDILIPTT